MKTLLAFLLLLSGVGLSNAISCSLCGADGLTPGAWPGDPWFLIPFKLGEATCHDVFALGAIDLSQNDCTFLQSLGKFYCMCQEGAPPPLEDGCKLCQDGRDLPFPSASPWPWTTCKELQNTAARNQVCPLYQVTLGSYCGCTDNVIPATACRLCGVGELLPRPNQVAGSSSCAKLEHIATLGGTCGETRRDHGDDCCAEVAPTPNPTVSPPTFKPGRFIPPPTPNPTTPRFPTFQPTLQPTTPIPTRLPTVVPATFQPTLQPTTPIPTRRPTVVPASCTLCGPNQVPFNPLAPINFAEQVQTCQQVHAIGNLSPTLGETQCSSMQSIGQLVCVCREGVPPPTNTCTLCEDGSTLETPQALVLPGITCAEMQGAAQYDFSLNCANYQGAFGTACGCSNPQARTSTCQLCGPGEFLPQPQRLVEDESCMVHEFTASMSNTCDAKRNEVGTTCCALLVEVNPICFPGDMVTKGVEGNQIPMKDLQVGDYIQDGEASFSRVYTFGHYDKEVKGSYLQIFSGDDSLALELSPEHMVYAGKGRQAVPAGSLQVGDLLLLERGSFVSITNIQTVRRRGAYAPFTESGKLVVNGVMASSYISLDHGLSKSKAMISDQWLAHVFQAPHRLCTRFGGCAESYTEDGISYYVSGLYNAAKWWMKQTHVIKVALFIPVFVVSLTIAAIEGMLMNTWATALVVLLVSLMWLYRVEKIVVVKR